MEDLSILAVIGEGMMLGLAVFVQAKGVSAMAKTGRKPSGYVKIAIENGHWNSEFSHE